VAVKLGQFKSRSEMPAKFTKWCQRRMEKISWTDRVNKGEVNLMFIGPCIILIVE